MRALTGVGMVMAVLLAACTSTPSAPADNTAQICAKAGELMQPDPEVGKKFTEAFQSSDPVLKQAADEAMAELYRKWAKSLEPLVNQATRPELRSALQEFVDGLGSGTLNSGAVQVMNLCGSTFITSSPRPSP